jgi:predicted phage terminase large subunit-like protein
MDSDRTLWLMAWWYGQVELDTSVGAQLALIRQHKPLWWFGEKGGQENSVSPVRRLLARESDMFASYKYLPHIGDKVAKIQAFRAMVREGRVKFPRERPWANRLVDLLVNFPNARFDDGPDVCGLLGRGIADMIPGEKPAVARRAPPKPFTEEWFAQRDRMDKPDADEQRRKYR